MWRFLSRNALGWLILSGLIAALIAMVMMARPTRLTIAVGPVDGDEARIIQSFNEYLARERSDVRLAISLTDGAEASAKAMAAGKADLAVTRSDMEMPRGATSVMSLRKFFPVIITSEKTEIKKVADLKGKTVGIGINPPQNRALAEKVLEHWGLKSSDYTFVPVAGAQIAAAVESGAIQAFFSTAVAGSRPSARLSEIMRGTWGTNLVVIPFGDVGALVSKIRGVEAGELVKGYFGGNPARPDEDLDTIAISNRLIASEKVTEPVAVELTKQLLAFRDKRQSEMPELLSVDTPSRMVNSLPVHAGTLAHVDGTYQNFVDKYSSFFYIGLILLGGVGSMWTTVKSRAKHHTRDEAVQDVQRILKLGDDIAQEADAGRINAALAEADRVLQDVLVGCARGDIDPSVLTATQAAIARCQRFADTRNQSLRGTSADLLL